MATADDIRLARENAKESQAQFAQRFGVDQSTIHRWETDGPPARGPAGMAIDQILKDMIEKKGGRRTTRAEVAAS